MAVEIKDGKKILVTPVSAEDLKDIHIGDIVYLTGDITTCRDVAHRRVVEEGREIPVDVRDAAIFLIGCYATSKANIFVISLVSSLRRSVSSMQ